MLDWFTGMLTNLLKDTGLAGLDPTLGAIASLIAITMALIGGIKFGFRSLHILGQQKPIDRLCKALIAHSMASKSEVIYQIRSYTSPHFTDKKTIRQLLHQIKKCSGDKQSAAVVFSVIGAPACGKTTTMRYLYCQLSKSRKCVYFQMQDVTPFRKSIPPKNFLTKVLKTNGFCDTLFRIKRRIHFTETCTFL